METLLEKHWHHRPSEDVADLLKTNIDKGLDLLEAQARQKHFGPNVLTPKKTHGPVMRFLLQFAQPLIIILIAAGLVTGFIVEWADASVILGVVLINAVIGFIQESKAAGAIEALARSMTTKANVVRSGRVQTLSSEELVPGDIVLLQSGDRVPADLRLFQLRELRVDESVLTGESIPVEKARGELGTETVLAERRNMAYASTLVTYGQARGIVVATGDRTEMGRISQLISAVPSLETPLTRRIAHFSKILLFVILGLGALTFGAGLLHGEKVVDMFMAAVALTVGSIPEGLPAAVTIILAVGVSRMAKRRAIIRRLPAVETLGSTTVICSDKTGTLTENQMTVRQVFSAGNVYDVSGSGYEPSGSIMLEGRPVDRGLSPALVECLRAGLLCNDSRVVAENGRWTVEGDPTEGALIVSARKMELAEEAENLALPRLDTIPFESEHQYMATLHATQEPGEALAYVKGSLESVLARCTASLDSSGVTVPLNHEEVRSAAEALARKGLRVLAFARASFKGERASISHQDISGGLVFTGLQGMIDPPRHEAVAAVQACQKAGIEVKMITGDHALTAAAIAQQIGLYRNPESCSLDCHVLTGKNLETFSDQEFIDVVPDTEVFARVSPEQKLRLVRALQTRGHIVAMTGDGVNDAPALKQADIGVAMGITGTEVAKEAADMVLTDDNFASIEAAVEEGRCVFDNLVKFLVWALPTNLGQGLVILAAVLAGLPLPILPVQSLWINMTTAGSLGLMLAFEPKELGIMARPPRNPLSPILSRELLFRILLVGFLLLVTAFGLFEWEELRGASHAEARTVAVNAFAVISALYLLNCRSMNTVSFTTDALKNAWVPVGIVTMIAIQVAFTHAPFMNKFFHSAPIGGESWARIVAVGVAAHLIVEVEKWLFRKKRVSGQRTTDENASPRIPGGK
jgi:cation-transporting P-type ATPase F